MASGPKSRFLSLPAELRIAVYENLLCYETHYNDKASRRQTPKFSAEILRVNRQIYGEAYECMVRVNKFIHIELHRCTSLYPLLLDKGGKMILTNARISNQFRGYAAHMTLEVNFPSWSSELGQGIEHIMLLGSQLEKFLKCLDHAHLINAYCSRYGRFGRWRNPDYEPKTFAKPKSICLTVKPVSISWPMCAESYNSEKCEVRGMKVIQDQIHTQFRKSMRLPHKQGHTSPITNAAMSGIFESPSESLWAKPTEVLSYLETYCEEEKYAQHVTPMQKPIWVDTDVFRGIRTGPTWVYLLKSEEFVTRFARLYVEFLSARIMRLWKCTDQKKNYIGFIAGRILEHVEYAKKTLGPLDAWNPSKEQSEVLDSLLLLF
ncbi:hypothetical protein DM02DRAFT_727577 [Periconia macrospinosa]|uniref:Uncharacterized protein n=1 Tax=Periconia macrospinosa TaxID=97972 RepID=A0A2V1DV30_9PLEO|nr:hypothetical protein DM02DRAFT_727577 [Periconia macrospinosa]